MDQLEGVLGFIQAQQSDLDQLARDVFGSFPRGPWLIERRQQHVQGYDPAGRLLPLVESYTAKFGKPEVASLLDNLPKLPHQAL